MRAARVAGAVSAVLTGAAVEAAAQGVVHEIKAGALYHDVGGLWSGFRLEPRSIDINAEVILRPGMPFLWGMIRPAIGATINTEGGTSKGYVDARWEIESPSGIFFSTGVGAAIHDGKLDASDPGRKALGSRLLFHIPAEIGWRWDGHNSISIYFEHMSNAYTQDYNEGLDVIGVRYGYRF